MALYFHICSYCGSKSTFDLQKHSNMRLRCANCGASVKEGELKPISPQPLKKPEKTDQIKTKTKKLKPSSSGSKASKKKKGGWVRFVKKAVDEITDIFD